MGVDYVQNCIFGFAVKAEDLLVELSPEITEEQPRYDTRTGKVSHYEKVRVKKAEIVYQFDGLEYEDIIDLADGINVKYEDLNCQSNSEYSEKCYLYVGYKLGKRLNRWGSRLLDGEVSIDELLNMKNSLVEKFPDFKDQIKIHFFWWAG